MLTRLLAIPMGLLLGAALAWALGLLSLAPAPSIRSAVLSTGDPSLPPPDPAPANLRPPLPPATLPSVRAELPASALPGPFERFAAPDGAVPEASDAWYVPADAEQRGLAWGSEPAGVPRMAPDAPLAEVTERVGLTVRPVPSTYARPVPSPLEEGLPEAGPVPYYSHVPPDRTLPPTQDGQ